MSGSFWCWLFLYRETDWFLTITMKISHCFHQPKRNWIKPQKIPYCLVTHSVSIFSDPITAFLLQGFVTFHW